MNDPSRGMRRPPAAPHIDCGACGPRAMCLLLTMSAHDDRADAGAASNHVMT